jgi:molybdopterin molybdotransferase
MAVDSSTQRISRLTPLEVVLASLDRRLEPVTPRASSLASAHGRVLAADVTTSKLPLMPIALRDGFAVAASAVADASSYTPMPFAMPPRRVDAGDPMPAGTDAVLPLDAVTMQADSTAAIAAVAPGEGVLPAGGDISAKTILRRGAYLRASDIAVMAAAGIADVMVREPRLRIACGGIAKTPVVQAAIDMLTRAVTAAGGTVFDADSEPERLYEALGEARAHAGFVVGGTGSGRGDSSVRTLARFGRVETHGIAVSPGETAAVGHVGARPVLLVPGRLDCALAIWLLIGRHIIAKLAGGRVEDAPRTLPLQRKVASTIGLTELIPVRYDQDAAHGAVADPLGSGYLSFESLTGSDGWISVPPDSEGFAAGTQVAVRPWP